MSVHQQINGQFNTEIALLMVLFCKLTHLQILDLASYAHFLVDHVLLQILAYVLLAILAY
jgi:hypothetical protein